MRLFFSQLVIAAACAGAAVFIVPFGVMVALFLGIGCANPPSSFWFVAGFVTWLYLFVNYYAHGKLTQGNTDGQVIYSVAAGIIGAPTVFFVGLPFSIFLLSSCVN